MKWLMLSIALVSSTPAFALTGNDFLKLSESSQTSLVVAYRDGFMLGAVMNGDLGSKFQKLQDCTRPWPGTQSLAVVQLYMKANPAEWGLPMDILWFRAVNPACGNPYLHIP